MKKISISDQTFIHGGNLSSFMGYSTSLVIGSLSAKEVIKDPNNKIMYISFAALGAVMGTYVSYSEAWHDRVIELFINNALIASLAYFINTQINN